MFTKELKIGDYIFTAGGNLARITKINQKTYSYTLLAEQKSSYYYDHHVVPFNGISRDEEWFECTDVQAEAFKAAIANWHKCKAAESILEENKKLVSEAKYYLEKVRDIPKGYGETRELPW